MIVTLPRLHKFLQNRNKDTYTIKKYVESITNNKAKRILYLKVCIDFMERVSDEIIYNKYTFKIPFRMGYIYIGMKQERKSSHKPINWVETKRLGKVIRHLNHHSDGRVFRWCWNKYDKYVEGEAIRIYEFKPSRTNRKKLSKHILLLAENPLVKNYTVSYERQSHSNNHFYRRMVKTLGAKANVSAGRVDTISSQ